MFKNPLLLGWLMDTKDDCFPYYLSKLEFLEIYGKQCSNHESTCKSAKTEKECNVKRRLQCTYTNNECVRVIDSICNYYDTDGKVKEEEWGEDQVSYIDDLYKTAVNVKFGEFMMGKEYDKTVKTTAFQMVSEKFNHVDYSSSEDSGCNYLIKQILLSNGKFMNQLLEMRGKAYKEMADEHSQPFVFTPTIKNSELALYVFELLKVKKCGSYKTIFMHDREDDTKIYEILIKGGVCFKEEDANNKSSAFFNLANFDKEDFEYNDKIPTTGFIWNLHRTIFDIVKGTFMGIGSIILTILKLVVKTVYANRDLIASIMSMAMLLIGGGIILSLIIQGCTLYSGSLVAYGPVASMAAYLESFTILTPILPYLQMLVQANAKLLCLLYPILQSNYVTDKITNMFVGAVMAKTAVSSQLVKLFNLLYEFVVGNKLPDIVNNLGNMVIGMKISKIIADFINKLILRVISPEFLFGTTAHGCGSKLNGAMEIAKYTTDMVSSGFKSGFAGFSMNSLFEMIMTNINKLKEVLYSSENFVYLKSFMEALYNAPSANIVAFLGVVTAFFEHSFSSFMSIELNISSTPYANIAKDMYDVCSMFIMFNPFTELQKLPQMMEERDYKNRIAMGEFGINIIKLNEMKLEGGNESAIKDKMILELKNVSSQLHENSTAVNSVIILSVLKIAAIGIGGYGIAKIYMNRKGASSPEKKKTLSKVKTIRQSATIRNSKEEINNTLLNNSNKTPKTKKKTRRSRKSKSKSLSNKSMNENTLSQGNRSNTQSNASENDSYVPPSPVPSPENNSLIPSQNMSSPNGNSFQTGEVSPQPNSINSVPPSSSPPPPPPPPQNNNI